MITQNTDTVDIIGASLLNSKYTFLYARKEQLVPLSSQNRSIIIYGHKTFKFKLIGTNKSKHFTKVQQ